MSKHLREDKICLNCGSIVEERYCTHCGQENLEPKELASHLFRHFFEDITHYDSKVFTTIKDLLFKPGFLTKEYLAGKRVRYLHPIRMYVFISFLYFLAFLSFNHSGEKIETALSNQGSLKTKKQIAANLHGMQETKSNDTLADKIKDTVINQILTANGLDTIRSSYQFVVVGDIEYEDLKTYDSIQHTLPEIKREKSLKSWFYSRSKETVDRYGEGTVERVSERTKHVIPKLMFFLLPMFALLLKLFYNRKKYLYVDHAIFSLHFHTAYFLLLFVIDLLKKAFPSFHLNDVTLILGFTYLVFALRNVYQQSILKSFFKAAGLVMLYSICIGIGFAVVAFTSFLF
jgi:hypothetical protein